MFYSLKSRTLLVAGIMLIIVIAIASYGRVIFENTIELSVENTQKQQELNRIIVGMKYPLSSIEGKLYKYLISLDDKDKEYLPLYVFELQTQLVHLKDNAIIKENHLFNRHAVKLDKQIKKLDKSLKTLSNFSRTERYPITKIINTKLNPSNQKFSSAIQTLLDNQDTLNEYPGMENVHDDIQQLRYIVVQIQSSTRLLFVSKTGIFGSADATLEFLLKNYYEYQRYLNELVAIFERLLTENPDELDLDVEEAIINLVQAKNARNRLILDVTDSVSSDHWREDLFYMQNTIQPILQSIQGEFNLMERRLEKRSLKNTINTQEASGLLSNFLWLFAGLIIVFFIIIYFAIDKSLRNPLIKISNAMHFQGSAIDGNALQEIGLKEIDSVIKAFNQMRKEIKIKQERLGFILQNLGEGIIVVDKDGQVDSFNSMAEQIFKTRENTIKNNDITKLLKINSIASDIEWLSNIDSDSRSEHLNYFLDGYRADGEHFKCDVTVSHMLLNNKDYAIIVAKDATHRLTNQHSLEAAKEKAEKASKQFEEQVIQLDQSMTELKETQDQLIESEKSASLAGLVAGVAHEINTPIGVSVTASSHLGEEIKTLDNIVKSNTITKTALDDFIEDALEASNIIDTNLQRAANLVKSFKMVAVDQTSNENRDINLKEYIDEVILSLRPKLKKTQHVIHNNIDSSISIYTSPGAFSQIFTNFIINSLIHGFEYKKQGTIHIESALQEGILNIIYKDDGKGMNLEQRKQVFEPFYTTKRGEGGSGLGMHIVFNLITQTLQGFVRCESEMDQGCLFELNIPIIGLQEIDNETSYS